MAKTRRTEKPPFFKRESLHCNNKGEKGDKYELYPNRD